MTAANISNHERVLRSYSVPKAGGGVGGGGGRHVGNLVAVPAVCPDDGGSR